MSKSEVVSAFDHGTLVDRIKDQVTFRCNHCGKDIHGYCRFKQHLGGISGEVTPFVEVPEDVKVQMRNSIARTKIAHVNYSPEDKNEVAVDVLGHGTLEDEDAKVHMSNSSERIKIGHVNNSAKSKNEASMEIRDHGTVVDKQKGQVRCNYCAKEVSGSYYRLKQHLAGIRGDVLPCVEVPQNIKVQMKTHWRMKKRVRQSFKSRSVPKRNSSSDDSSKQNGNHVKSSQPTLSRKRKHSPIIE